MIALLKIEPVQPVGLLKEWRIEVIANVVRQRATRLTLPNAGESALPCTTPYKSDLASIAPCLSNPSYQGTTRKPTVESVLRYLLLASEWAGPGCQNAREAGAVQEQAG